jgi:hypothetical protein
MSEMKDDNIDLFPQHRAGLRKPSVVELVIDSMKYAVVAHLPMGVKRYGGLEVAFPGFRCVAKRYRSAVEQRVVVQHQHVNVTAEQAAVQVTGGADPAPGGRGVAPKPEEQSHALADTACLAYAPEPAMPCPDPAGDAVPVAGGEREAPLPDARRD